MADKILRRLDSETNWANQKMKDLGDGSFAKSVVDEGQPSSKVSVTNYSNAALATLVSTVNAYLAGSTKRHLSTIFMNDGLVSLTFYAVVIEAIQ